MPIRPRTVVFDVVETLMSLAPLRSRLTDVGLAAGLLERWFDRTLREGMALTLTGHYQPFPVVAESALRTLARDQLPDNAIAHVLAGFDDLPAHPDAETAMRSLAEAGVTMVCLSNGTVESTTDFLARNALSGYVHLVLSAAEVNTWKPARTVYDHALRTIGRPAAEVALIAVHAFDCHGAKCAGWTTGWASRLEGHYAEMFAPPDIVGDDLVDVVTKLLALD